MGQAESNKVREIPFPAVTSTSFSGDANWFAAVFKVPVENIKDLRSTCIQPGKSGSILHKIEIDWEGVDLPSSMVAKTLYVSELPPRDLILRSFQLEWTPDVMARKEVGFYSEIRKMLVEVGVQSPKCYYVAYEDGGDCNALSTILADARTNTKMLLLLEDLGLCRKYKMGEMFSPKDAMKAVLSIARLHSRFWNIKIEGNYDMTTHIYNVSVPSDIKKHLVGWFIVGDDFAKKLMEQWKDSEFNQLVNIVPNFQDNLQLLANQYNTLLKPFMTSQKLEGSDLFQNITFLHGDLHGENLFFSQEEVIFYDWQAYGYGHNTTELSNFISTSVKFDPEGDKELLGAYYEELTGDFGKGVLVKKEDYPYHVFQREILIRMISYGLFFSMFLNFMGPGLMKSLTGDKEAEEHMFSMMVNLFERVFFLVQSKQLQLHPI
eukprot:TRINITY_DN2378_c0_g3_i2.p1 TRINITY_DN2378_c0_g3~~TRINITY_DN2378_c0_g3_i2.p1  ORF type:complete len:434 (+),score=110.91 TRINITY_DN2378_c0_g3_i2:2-1303(+)